MKELKTPSEMIFKLSCFYIKQKSVAGLKGDSLSLIHEVNVKTLRNIAEVWIFLDLHSRIVGNLSIVSYFL